jgi:hypothetical protein
MSLENFGEILVRRNSGNFAPDWNGLKILANPPGSHYGLVLQKIEFLKPDK